MASLRTRLMRLEARLPLRGEHSDYLAAQVKVSFLLAFLSAAIPDTRQPLAAHFARMFGLPDAPAMRALLRGEDAQTIARERYGPTWREDMEATAAASAAALEAAHGSAWEAQIKAIFEGRR